MQLVIEISDTLKNIADNEDAKTFSHIVWQALLMDAIKNGQPLPAGHGRLIDADDMIADLQKQCKEVFKLDAVKPEDYYIAKDAKFMQATWKEWCDSFCVWANNRKEILEADGGDTE